MTFPGDPSLRQRAARRLDGRVVLATGAAGTRGRVIADAVAREGGTPLRTDLCGVVGRDIDHVHDVAAEDDGQRVVGAIGERCGRLDGLGV